LEVKTRIYEELDLSFLEVSNKKASSHITVSTFHSLCAKILRKHSNQYNVPSNFGVIFSFLICSGRTYITLLLQILNTSDQKQIFMEILNKLNNGSGHYRYCKWLVRNKKFEIINELDILLLYFIYAKIIY
jgi:superfamily I DNA/RNA helicase